MRKASVLFLSILFAAVSAAAEDRHQSYFSYEDGGTVVLQSDGSEADARQNFPLFPGDEIRTSRRGRAEVRLSDGNVIAIDGATAIRFESILDSFEGEGDQTVANLSRGQVIVHRLIDNSEALRLDTPNASYLSAEDAIYGVRTDGRGNDVLSVYEGSIEVRTPAGTTRVRGGEQANVDDRGVYGEIELARTGLTDFERWFLQRADRHDGNSNRYLNTRLSYADSELNRHGRWVWVGDYGAWAWRPYVGAGWRPYYDGRWIYSPGGGMVWVSYEPWGWVPYHYGRWSFSPGFGWVWLPGWGYSHAWVYWAWGPSYVGWAPAGWYDCFTPYYGWAYRPYSGYGYGRYGFGAGFYGHIRLGRTDLTPWTFVTPGGLVSDRIDRAALTTQAIRERLDRDGDRATVSRGIRLTRDEMRDPDSAARAISRRGLGGGTGKEGSGNTTDLTPFFRRDPELSSDIRNRLTRPLSNEGGASEQPRGDTSERISRGGGGTRSTPEAGPTTGRVVTRGRDVSTPTTTNGGRTIGRGNTAPTPATPADVPSTGRIGRERPAPREGVSPAPERSEGTSRSVPRGRPAVPRDEGSSNWRSNHSPSVGQEPAAPTTQRSRQDTWRSVGRNRVDNDAVRRSDRTTRRSDSSETQSKRSVSRTVIDGIGGPRVTPKRSGGSSDSVGRSRPAPRESAPPKVERSRESGSSSRPSTSSSPSRSSGSSTSKPSSDSRGSGRIKRD